MMNKLDIINISKNYNLKKIVSNVSIAVNTGEILGFLGQMALVRQHVFI